jgi:transmembrane sensor
VKPLSRYVEVDTSPERISKIWSRVSLELQTGEQAPRARRSPAPLTARWFTQPRIAWAGGAVMLALAVVGITRPWRADFELWGLDGAAHPSSSQAQRLKLGQGATLETNQEPLAVSIHDGSGLALSPNTRIEIDQGAGVRAIGVEPVGAAHSEGDRSRVAVRLAKGKVQCDVTPNPKRSFVVHAGGVEVRVTGTSFSVELSPNQDEVRVQVKAGTVEVAPPGSTGHERRLSAGEAWAIDLDAASSGATSASGGVGAVAGEVSAAGPTRPAQSGEPAAPSAGPGSADLRARRSAPVVAEQGEPAAESSAPQLFDRANAARREGDVGEAARGYEALLAKFPNDGRAGLAAFELGRLRMDRLGDMSGAVTALKRAVAMAPGSGFREDAMARLVQAYAALGAKASCRSARDAYLKAYPKGVHLATVSRKCE